MKLKYLLFSLSIIGLSACANNKREKIIIYNNTPGLHSNYPKDPENLSEAMKRNLSYQSEYPMENELYSHFKYTPLRGLEYNNDDGTLTRRDPSKVLFENGKYYVWYTHRETESPIVGGELFTDTKPAVDWDLSEIWYATSKDGFTWKEQGVAIPRAPKGQLGHRSVCTADILKFKGKYYLYYQAYTSRTKGMKDVCPVTMSYSDSPDGPWTPCNKIVVSKGAKGEWDEHLIHDPYPLVHNGKIYLYYKSGYNHRDAGGLAISKNPAGPFIKCKYNPVLNSGHEVSLFPYKEGVAAIVARVGNEHNTIQYAKDWVNFKIASFDNLMPIAPGPFIKDAFTDSHDGQGISWGICHFTGMGEKGKAHSILYRFDCDLSREFNDSQFKGQEFYFPKELYFSQHLSKAQLKRILKRNN